MQKKHLTPCLQLYSKLTSTACVAITLLLLLCCAQAIPFTFRGLTPLLHVWRA